MNFQFLLILKKVDLKKMFFFLKSTLVFFSIGPRILDKIRILLCYPCICKQDLILISNSYAVEQMFLYRGERYPHPCPVEF